MDTQSNSCNYYAIVTQKPIKKFCLNIKINDIEPSYRYLNIGFVTEGNLNSVFNKENLNSLILSHSNCSYYFYGWGYAGISGTNLGSSASDANGLRNGYEFTISFKNNILSFFDKDKKLNLTADLSNDTNKYYLVMSYYNPKLNFQASFSKLEFH